MTDSAAIAHLKAEAAQAAADAAAAKAAAAQAALDAALATGDPDHPEPQAEESAQAATAAPAEPGGEQAEQAESNGQDTAPPSNTTEAPPSQTEPAPPADAPSSENTEHTENAQSTEDTGETRSADGSGDTGYTAQVRSGYSFSSPTLPVGTYLDTLAGGDPAPVPGLNVGIPLGLLNRHALVAGATGTGKTRTLQMLAEGLSGAGVPVFLADVKGDLTGLAEAGAGSDKLLSRTAANGQEWAPAAFPVELLSLGGADSQFPGVPVRAQVSDFGPILLARALSLNTTQEQALQLIFAWADSQGLELVDLPDLRSVISFLTSEDGKDELAGIGGVSKATAGVVLRALTALESQGGGQFFGAPGFDTADLIRSDSSGRGMISLLGVGDISSRPALVSAVIMFLLADLFSTLPEVGDVERPKLVFFFDEAHLLFADATKEFERQVVQTVRLIRSKGVGVVFVTQTPKDIPSDVLAQLGSRIQHGLRASTPEDFKKLKATVQTFPKTGLELDEVLTTLGTGEAVVTVLDPKGNPTPVTPVGIWAPASVMGPASDGTVARVNRSSSLMGRYADSVNPESAEERLASRAAEAQAAREAEKARAAAEKEEEKARAAAQKEAERARAAAAKEAERSAREAQRAVEKAVITICRLRGR